MKQFFKKMLFPNSVKEEKMEAIWSKRSTKMVRIVCEFENGIKRELVGEDAEIYAKTLFWIQNGWTHLWSDLSKLEWKDVIKN